MSAQQPLATPATSAPREIVVRIPGEPVAQGRPRAFVNRQGQARVYDPEKSRSWKGQAQVHMREALEAATVGAPLFAEGPVELRVVAVFTCPKSDWRKRPVERRPKHTRPDAENVAKAIQDAGTGLLWLDDSQITRLIVEKFVGAQEEAPYVELVVREMPRLGAWPPGCPLPMF